MKLQQFQQFSHATILQPVRTKLVVPPFILAATTWANFSVLLAQFPLTNIFNFAFKTPVKKFGTNFIAAVRYYDPVNDIIVRYKFWDDPLAVLYFPVYDGETINLNAVIEIWSVDTISFPTLLANQFLPISVLNFPLSNSCSTCCVVPENDVMLIQSTPSVLPAYAYCNPFCVGLCEP